LHSERIEVTSLTFWDHVTSSVVIILFPVGHFLLVVLWNHWIGLDWAVFYVSANTVKVIWETVFQVRRPNQHYQNT